MDKLMRKTFDIGQRKTIDAEAGIYEAWISTESVDRGGDVLLGGGAVLENYFKNPIVLFGHNYWNVEAVVGRALEVEPVPGSGVRARWQFPPIGDNPKADIVHRLWAGEFLNATSVGFKPIEWSRRQDENGEDLARGWYFTSWELLEYSIVPVPANQDALRLAMKAFDAGLDTPEGALTKERKCPSCGDAFDVSATLDYLAEEKGYQIVCPECAADESPWIRGVTLETETEPIDELSGGESPDSKSDDPDPEPAIDDNDELTDEDLDALDDAIAELENAVEGGI